MLVGTELLYGLGVSTNPYGNSHPSGIGVATTDSQAHLAHAEIAGSGWPGSLLWEPGGHILVQKQDRWERYRFEDGTLADEGGAPLPSPVINADVSPGGSLLAYEPIRQVKAGYTSSLKVMVEQADGSHRRQVAKGSLAGWAPNGELLVWPAAIPSGTHTGPLEAVNLRTNRITPLKLSGARVALFAGALRAELGAPIFSPSGRWMAAQAVLTWRKGHSKGFSAIVIANGADGTPVRVLESPYHISMLAWSPVSDELAYTTSGFPFPHQLIVVSSLEARPRVLFTTSAHFDWLTWSPDGQWILLDHENFDTGPAWLVLQVKGGAPIVLPRLGGEPMWCCPVGQFVQAV